jgi:hypothetical protein
VADRWDVAGRLAEGRTAVEHTQTYVQACHALGYQQPDLTAHASQVQDSYGAESGLDLKVLDNDSLALCAAVNAVEEALWIQRAQVTELAAGWRGSGADSATRFLQRHCDAAAEVVARVRSAAEGCATLRDNLWRSIDSKVATTIAIDERQAAQQSAWLAAAHTVTTATAERSVAEELIRRQVTPYVDNDIRNDWLAVMNSTAASIAASYDATIHALTLVPDVRFEIPGELGPSWHPTFGEAARATPAAQAMPGISAPADPVPTVPAAAQTTPPAATPEPADPPLPIDGEAAAPLGDMGGLTGGASGLGGIAGGIEGVIGSIVDGISGLIGALTGGLGDGSSDSPLDDPVDVDDPNEPVDEGVDDAEPVAADEPLAPEQPAEQLTESPPAAVEAVDEPAAPPPIGPPPADQPPPDDQPPPPTGLPPEGSTPCEIAEDQLPQAGQ